MITLGSLFDGIGGFPLAGQRVGIQAVWASEIETFPIKVSKLRFPEMKQLGDITKINGAEIEPVDIITGGSPCQDMSIAGKREGMKIYCTHCGYEFSLSEFGIKEYKAGVLECPKCEKKEFESTRSGLFMEQIRIVKEMRQDAKSSGTTRPIRPRFMVWENVPGAFSSNKGEDFRCVLEETAKIADETVVIPRPPKGKWNTVGCIMGNGWSIAWRVLDAQYWGVPQRRRRIFLVADFGGQSAPEVLFKSEGLSRHLAESRDQREGTTADIERSVDKAIAIDCNNSDSRFRIAGGVMPTITARLGTGGNNGPMLAVSEEITPKTMLIRCGKEGGGKGALIQDNKSATLGCSNIQTLFAPTYCIQGNCIDRADTAGCDGKGWTEDVCYTLNTVDRPAVVAFTQNQREEVRDLHNKAGALAAEAGIHQQTYIAVLESGKPAVAYGADLSQKAEGICFKEEIATCVNTGTHGGHGNNVVTYSMQRSDEFKQSEQACTQSRRQYKDSTDLVVYSGYSVRRLTPLECERLQDFPDFWTDILGASDSARYKSLGNSVAVCCPEYVLEGIKRVLENG